MRATCGAIGIAAALVLSLLAGQAGADDAKKAEELAKAMAEASKPGPEHAKLQPLVGSWAYTCKFWMDPSKPPVESHGTIERQWVLGGRFLEERTIGTGFDGKPGFEGFGLVGYDNGRKQYTSSWVSNMCTGTCNGLGTSDTSGRKFTFHAEVFCPVQKKLMKSREELRIEADGKTIAESYILMDGKEIKLMEIVAVRKK